MSTSITMAPSKGRLSAVIAAAALSFAIALGFAIPTQASAAEDSAALATGSAQSTAQLTAQADASMLDPDWVDLWAGCDEIIMLNEFLADTDGAIVTSVTSSDTSVLKVTKLDSEKTIWSYRVHPLKVGTAKLSITLSQNGVTKNLSETYTVKTMPKVMASLTLNGESLPVPSANNPITEYECFGFKGTSAKINVKPASGWEITHMSAYRSKLGSSGESFEVTNGTAFTIPTGKQGYADISIVLYNSTSAQNFSFRLGVYRTMPIQLVSKPTYYIGYPKTCAPQYKMTYNSSYITVISVKSSKPGVIAAKSNKEFHKIKLRAKKPGKSKITIKYKYKGRTFTASAKSTVAKDYPVKSALINGKSIKLKKNSFSYVPKTYTKNKAKIKIKAAKGWKVKSLKRYSGFISTKGTKVKNGKAVKTPEGQYTYVLATLKKGKRTFTYGWYFNRI